MAILKMNSDSKKKKSSTKSNSDAHAPREDGPINRKKEGCSSTPPTMSTNCWEISSKDLLVAQQLLGLQRSVFRKWSKGREQQV